jgi:hypothetical protein
MYRIPGLNIRIRSVETTNSDIVDVDVNGTIVKMTPEMYTLWQQLTNILQRISDTTPENNINRIGSEIYGRTANLSAGRE